MADGMVVPGTKRGRGLRRRDYETKGEIAKKGSPSAIFRASLLFHSHGQGIWRALELACGQSGALSWYEGDTVR